MLRFTETMDPQSLDIRRDGKLVGMIQVHRERGPRLTVISDIVYDFSLDELKEITQRLDSFNILARDRKPPPYL